MTLQAQFTRTPLFFFVWMSFISPMFSVPADASDIKTTVTTDYSCSCSWFWLKNHCNYLLYLFLVMVLISKPLLLLVIPVPVHGFDWKTIWITCYTCSWWGFWKTPNKLLTVSFLIECYYVSKKSLKSLSYNPKPLVLLVIPVHVDDIDTKAIWITCYSCSCWWFWYKNHMNYLLFLFLVMFLEDS